MNTKIKILGTISILFSLQITSVNAADNYIYRFKDKSGKIIYSDRLPSNEKGEFAILSTKSGAVKKVVEKELSDDDIKIRDVQKIEDKKAIENNTLQKKKDISLLSTYSNVQEIDKMKKYELDQIDQGIKSNIDNIATLKDKLNVLEENKKQTPDNKNIQEEYEKTNNNLNMIQQILNSNKAMYVQREKKYDDDKNRYLDILREMSENKEKELKN